MIKINFWKLKKIYPLKLIWYHVFYSYVLGNLKKKNISSILNDEFSWSAKLLSRRAALSFFSKFFENLKKIFFILFKKVSSTRNNNLIGSYDLSKLDNGQIVRTVLYPFFVKLRVVFLQYPDLFSENSLDKWKWIKFQIKGKVQIT